MSPFWNKWLPKEEKQCHTPSHTPTLTQILQEDNIKHGPKDANLFWRPEAMLEAGASDQMWKRQNKIYCHIFLLYNLFVFFLIEV